MSENLFCDGQKYITDNYKDGWLRSYKGYPPMNDKIKVMLHDYAKRLEYTNILLFFGEICNLDGEYSAFLMREVIRGYI